ncbi:hypothetical protein CA267_002015 [Alteromonas pelagimontana]|uniref:YopX protein domain-containing protein n=1 Tax=Alteromonas pelagimontana TaxID=1858656 RepID=A0A6M4M9L2_9ALTE|nr:YopX family protein [Alteromonas pelagimontana]QJR79659.1 hypothetical protein CA267_002015 [Alteromonas pelagimontana]
MREIKFRAWRPEKGMTLTPILKRSDYTGKVYCEGFDKSGKLIHLDMMQYTGLNDTNGKEIYEGDIIEIDKNLPQFNAVVAWNSESASFSCYQANDPDKEFYCDHIYGIDASKVIGNIYENAELLGDKS